MPARPVTGMIPARFQDYHARCHGSRSAAPATNRKTTLMLDALRRGAPAGWLKPCSRSSSSAFGIFWNVADVFRGFGRGSIAHVGSHGHNGAMNFIAEFQQLVRSTSERVGTAPDQRAGAPCVPARPPGARAVCGPRGRKGARGQAGGFLSDTTPAELLRNDPGFRWPRTASSRKCSSTAFRARSACRSCSSWH